jgi:amino acid efflux transporter
VPRRPLVLIACVGVVLLGGLLAGLGNTEELVRATSVCFIAVYVLVLASAVRILDGRTRLLALVTLVLTIVLAVFSAWYLLVPAVAGAVALLLKRLQRSTLGP